MALDAGAGKTCQRDLFDALTNFRVVAVARHVHQARVEALIGIAPYQQAHRAPLVQVDDAADDADQIGETRLEQLVARIGLEHVEHGLAVVAGRIETEVLDDALDLAAQHRDVARAAVVGGRSPQADEAVLAIDAAAAVKGLHADVVEQLAAMHRGGGVGLGDDQQLRLAGAFAHVAAQHRHAAAAGGAPRAAEHAQARAAVGNQAVLGAAALQAIATGAEEYEVLGFHPVEQVRSLAYLFG